jgi:hypothetical protein
MTRVIVALALGLITSTAVSWWILWPWRDGNAAIGTEFDEFLVGTADRPHLVQTDWMRGFREVVIMATWRAPPGYPVPRSQSQYRPGARADVPSYAVFPGTDDAEVTAATGASGWPFLCLCGTEYEVRNAPGRRPVVTRRTSTFLTSDTLPFLGPGRYLPIRPIWPGLVADTTIYAVPWLALLSLSHALRRWWRLRRNHCPACNYDLRATPLRSPCPECGAART